MKSSAKRVLSLVIVLAMALAMLPVIAFAAGTTTVYCQAPDNWSTCKAYWWGSSSTNPGWPGVDMTQNEEGIWYFEVPSDATGLIFTNGSGIQTDDLSVPTDDQNMYVFNNKYWTTYGKVEVIIDYYVAGSAGLCGVEWNPGAAANKMTKTDGIYTITFTGIAAGDYEFKVTNGTWDQSWGNGAGNCTLSVAEDGASVKISFNPETFEITASVNDETVTDPIEAGYYVAGSMNDWQPAAKDYLMNQVEESIYSLNIDLAAGAYALKVTDGTWNNSWGGTGADGNYEFNVVEDGTVTVTFDAASGTVTVTGDCLEETVKEPLIINTVHAVGAAGLMGVEWDPAANEMVVKNNVYIITFTGVAAGTYEYKFAANGAWDINWAAGEETVSGETYTAWFNATANNTVVVPANNSTVTLTLDLSAMDPISGEGATCSAVVVTDELPPVPVDPVYYVAGSMNSWNNPDDDYRMTKTDENIYVLNMEVLEGACELKVTDGTWDNAWGVDGANYAFYAVKAGVVTVTFDAAAGTVTVTGDCIGEAPAPERSFYVAGTMNGWNNPDEAYLMTASEDGTYTLTFALTAGDHELKVTDGTWDNSWGADGGNYAFKTVADGEITVTFDPSSCLVTVTGDCIAEKEPMVIESVYAVGAEGLMGTGWDPTHNEMTNDNGVYTITFTGIAAGTYEYKFAANGNWNINWAAGVETVSGETYTAWFNAQGNNILNVAEDNSTVTLTLDLTTMDPITGEGATCSAVVTAAPAGVTVSGAVETGTADDATIELIADGAVVASTTVSGKKGTYTLENVAAGTYTLKVTELNHVTREYTVTVAAEDLTQNVKICLLGDVNGDGRVNIGDAAKVYSHVKQTAQLTDEYQLICANVNGGKLNIGDAASLYSHVRGTKKLY